MSVSARVPVICIDGPSGSGKGTLARNLAAELGFAYLDSGALYRVLAVLSARHNIALSQRDELVEMAENIDVQFVDNQVLHEDEDISPEIRLETTAGLASQLAALPEVRAALVATQRHYARMPGLVADGRDMGTVIFPDSPLKIFLMASAEERAKRRLKQLQELTEKKPESSPQKPASDLDANNANQLINKDLNPAGGGDSLRALVAEIQARDQRDMNRETSPLRPADDAIEIDCTSLSIDEVLDKVRSLWRVVGL